MLTIYRPAGRDITDAEREVIHDLAVVLKFRDIVLVKPPR